MVFNLQKRKTIGSDRAIWNRFDSTSIDLDVDHRKLHEVCNNIDYVCNFVLCISLQKR